MRIGNQQLLIGAQLKNFRPEVLSADPDVASLVAGQKAVLWFNETEGKYKFFNGTEIKALGGDAELPDNVFLADGTVPMTADLKLSSADQSASEDTAAVSKGYMAGEISDAVSGKQDKFTGLTENGIVVAGPNNTLTTSNVTAAELGYLDGVTSAIQTQLDSKLSKDNAELSSDLNANNHKVTNLAAPTNANDAARKIDIDNALSGLNWQEDVDGIQTDATLQPSKANGSRYVITDAAALHADFGTIADVANNVIVEADADGEYHVVFDPTAERADGAIAWNHATSQYVRFDGSAWANFGGMSSITNGDGLELAGNTLNVLVDRAITIVGNKVGLNVAAAGGIDINGTNEVVVKRDGTSLSASADGLKVADGGVGYTQIAAAALGAGLKQDADTSTIVVDAAALKTLGFIDATGGNVAALELTGDAADYTDTSAVNKAYVDQAIAAGGAAGAAKLYVYDKTAAEDTAATVHTFAHNAGTKFGTVTVFDETGYQIIPDEVVLVDENTVRVELVEAKKVAIAFVTVPKSNGSTGGGDDTDPVEPAQPVQYSILMADNGNVTGQGLFYAMLDTGGEQVKQTVWNVASGSANLSNFRGPFTMVNPTATGDVVITATVTKADGTTETITSAPKAGSTADKTIYAGLGPRKTNGKFGAPITTYALGFGGTIGFTLIDSRTNTGTEATTAGIGGLSGQTITDVEWFLYNYSGGTDFSAPDQYQGTDGLNWNPDEFEIVSYPGKLRANFVSKRTEAGSNIKLVPGARVTLSTGEKIVVFSGITTPATTATELAAWTDAELQA